jgi:hypothetical protein
MAMTFRRAIGAAGCAARWSVARAAAAPAAPQDPGSPHLA